MPKFSIIIPTATQFDLLQKCLESVVQYTDLDDVEIIVVANGAPREVRALNYPINLLWFDEMIGFTRAINEAFKVAKGEYLILLNDDCELLGQPKNHWLDRLYAPFSDDKVAITGPLYDRCPSTDRDFLLFFCVMISRRALNELGTLDEIFNPGAGEDCDWTHRAEDRGWKMVAVGGEPVYADRGDPTLPAHQQGQWVTSFPLWHKAGCTVSTIEGWPEIFARNAEILRKRYGVNLDRAKTIEGWMADSELEWLAKQAKKSPTFVEVGAWHGRSTRAIADNLCEGGTAISCDSWNGSSGEPDAHATAHLREGDDAFLAFWNNNHDHILSGKIIPIRMQSVNAGMMLRHLNVLADIVWIDADHSYEGCKADILSFRELVKKGGMLCGHDYYLPEQNPLAWVGVRQCVDELFPGVQQAPDTTIWFVRCTCLASDKCDVHGIGNEQHVALRQLLELPVTESYQGYGGFFNA